MDQPPNIPDLELLRRIGRGSYGEVWIARTLTGVYRAVKIVYRARFADDRPFLRELDGITRFQRSAGNQPRQLALMHVGRDDADRFFYYTMELADDVERGTDIDPEVYEPYTVKSLRERGVQLPAIDVVRLGVELARALAGLHDAGLIHRDVKPSNIILVGGVPKLADIGLVSSGDHTLTSLGTPGYSPPEGAGTIRADIFSLGRILYELATGRGPSEFPRLPSDLEQRRDVGVLLEINEVILRACDPKPQSRYASVQEMLEDLLLIQAGKSVKELLLVRRRLKLLGKAAAVVGLAALAVIAVLGVRHYFVLRELAATEAQARMQAEEDERLARYTADLQLAQLALTQQDLGIARTALRRQIPAAGEPDLRGPEWYALWNDSAGNEARVYGEPGGPPVRAIDLAPNGSMLAVHVDRTDEGQTQLWDIATATSRVVAGSTRGLAGFTKDGTQLIVADEMGRVRLVQADTGLLHPWQPNRGELLYAVGDGSNVVTYERTGESFRYQIWDATAGAEADAFRPEPRPFRLRPHADAVSRDGRRLALSLFWAEGTVRRHELLMWDLDRETSLWRYLYDTQIDAMTISPDGAWLAAATADRTVLLIDARTGEIRRELVGHTGRRSVVAFSPDGRLLATGGEDQIVRIWGVSDGALVETLRGHEATVTGVAWSGDATTVFTASDDGTVRRWNVPTTVRPTSIAGLWDQVLGDFLFLPLTRQIAATNKNGAIAILDAGTLEASATMAEAFQPLSVLSGSPEFLALSSGGRLVRCNPANGTVTVMEFALDDSPRLMAAAASRDGTIAVLGNSDGAIIIWNLADGTTLTPTTRHRDAIWEVALNEAGTLAATGDRNGLLRIWSTRDGRSIRELDLGKGAIRGLTFHRDQRMLVVGLESGVLLLVNTDTGAIAKEIRGHSNAVNTLAWSTDGSRLTSAGNDGFVVFWSPDLRPIAVLPFLKSDSEPADKRIFRVQFSPDGQQFGAFSEDGRLRIWRLDESNR